MSWCDLALMNAEIICIHVKFVVSAFNGIPCVFVGLGPLPVTPTLQNYVSGIFNKDIFLKE